MPNTSAAKKALRQNTRQRIQNNRIKRAFRYAVKQVQELAHKNQIEEAEQQLPRAFKSLDKAVKRGMIKENMASRKKARLHKRLAKAKAGEKV